jgi:hypothetical protein
VRRRLNRDPRSRRSIASRPLDADVTEVGSGGGTGKRGRGRVRKERRREGHRRTIPESGRGSFARTGVARANAKIVSQARHVTVTASSSSAEGKKASRASTRRGRAPARRGGGEAARRRTAIVALPE